ncbi:hypothetical protein BFG48_009810 [Acinetobacter nosocomialis]|nr:hypothetical protein BFG48_009810 [Acinetobacter nosocomialis]
MMIQMHQIVDFLSDTRRKILIGSCMLKITGDDEKARAKLITQMDKYLTSQYKTDKKIRKALLY